MFHNYIALRFGLGQIVYRLSIKIAEMAIGGKNYFEKRNIISPWQAILTSVIPSRVQLTQNEKGKIKKILILTSVTEKVKWLQPAPRSITSLVNVSLI